MASRMISLVVAYSPASTAAFRTASCSPVTATLIFWMSGIVHLELTDGRRNYYLVANMSIEDAISKGGTRVVLKADHRRTRRTGPVWRTNFGPLGWKTPGILRGRFCLWN